MAQIGPLNPSQSAVYREITSRKEPVYFIAAPGGSGKTFLVNRLVKTHKPGEVMLTATTNQAATNFPGLSARTVHRAFKLMESDATVLM